MIDLNQEDTLLLEGYSQAGIIQVRNLKSDQAPIKQFEGHQNLLTSLAFARSSQLTQQ